MFYLQNSKDLCKVTDTDESEGNRWRRESGIMNAFEMEMRRVKLTNIWLVLNVTAAYNNLTLIWYNHKILWNVI